jgi:hypothetical protein
VAGDHGTANVPKFQFDHVSLHAADSILLASCGAIIAGEKAGEFESSFDQDAR